MDRTQTTSVSRFLLCLSIVLMTFSCATAPKENLSTNDAADIAGALAAPTTLAATAAIDTSLGPCDASVFHEFDFWLGTWEVHAQDGKRAGTNNITAQQQHCLLLEEWVGASGSSGTSINYYDAEAKQWTQQWISPGTQITIRGGLQQNAMVLEGFIYYTQNNRKAAFRGTWTPLKDGRVRQFFQERNDDGEWTTWFEGFYTKD